MINLQLNPENFNKIDSKNLKKRKFKDLNKKNLSSSSKSSKSISKDSSSWAKNHHHHHHHHQSNQDLNHQVDYQINQDFKNLNEILINSNQLNQFDQQSNLSLTSQNSLVGLTQAEIISKKWLSISQLNELSNLFGLKFQKGRFTTFEQNKIQIIVDKFCKEHSYQPSNFSELITSKKSSKSHSCRHLLYEITQELQVRPIVSVWHYLRRTYNPLSKLGPWQKDQDERLKTAVQKYGSAWTQVSQVVGRSPDDCKDRWRNYGCVQETKNNGPWSEAEEQQLIQLMSNTKLSDCDGLWTFISQQMNGKRSRAQCRVKWVENILPRLKREGSRQLWKHIDVLTLAKQLLKHNMSDDVGFDWKKLLHDGWDTWSPAYLQRRWCQIKRFMIKKLNLPQNTSNPTIIKQILDGILKQWSKKSPQQLNKAIRYSDSRKRP